MSAQGDITDFMVAMSNGTPNGKVDITPDQIALQTGITRDKVNKTLHNLMTRGRVELFRGPNGRSITGYRMLEAPPDKRRKSAEAKPAESAPAPAPARSDGHESEPEAQPPKRHNRRIVYTPVLDEYLRQKAVFTRLVDQLGDRVEATFKDDPLAEEALQLRERLDLVEEQMLDWRHKAEGWEHETKALRTRHVQAVERKAVEAGAVVQHSSD